MNKKPPLIVLTGPTAVGKTALSIKLAKTIGAEIISADSMQVYKKMNIGTAKVTPKEMDGIKHYLIDILEPTEEFNVFNFKMLAKDAIEEIYSKGKIPIIAGGTGFYIQSVLYDIDFTENENDTTYRDELAEIAATKGADYLHNMLEQVDKDSARAIHKNNVKRVIRALEYYKQTGEPISKHNEVQRENESPYNFVYFVLNDDREKIYERINKRVDIMVENGLKDEVLELCNAGFRDSITAMKAIGYSELLDYVDGKLSFEEAVEKIKTDTRHFAKRQLTWFGREKAVTWVNINEYTSQDDILEYMTDILKEKEILGDNK